MLKEKQRLKIVTVTHAAVRFQFSLAVFVLFLQSFDGIIQNFPNTQAQKKKSCCPFCSSWASTGLVCVKNIRILASLEAACM